MTLPLTLSSNTISSWVLRDERKSINSKSGTRRSTPDDDVRKRSCMSLSVSDAFIYRQFLLQSKSGRDINDEILKIIFFNFFFLNGGKYHRECRFHSVPLDSVLIASGRSHKLSTVSITAAFCCVSGGRI